MGFVGPRVFLAPNSPPLSYRVMITLVLSSGVDCLLGFALARLLVHVWLISFALRLSNFQVLEQLFSAFTELQKLLLLFQTWSTFAGKHCVWFFYPKYFHFSYPEKRHCLSSCLPFSQENLPCFCVMQIRSSICHSRSIPLRVPDPSRADSLKLMEVRTDSSMSLP